MPETPIAPEALVTKVCADCGSTDVLADAFAEWDFANQCWTVQSIMDKGHYCTACDGECRIEERPLTGEGTAAIEAAARQTTTE